MTRRPAGNDLELLAVAAGERLAAARARAVQDEDRPLLGAWPGTVTEARAGVLAAMRAAGAAEPSVARLRDLAHRAYGAARRRWLAACATDRDRPRGHRGPDGSRPCDTRVVIDDPARHAPFLLVETLDDSEPPSYSLILSDEHVGHLEELFGRHGRDPGGYGWADVAQHLVESELPVLAERVRFDPEGGMFCAYGSDLAALDALGAALATAFHDHARLEALVAAAPFVHD